MILECPSCFAKFAVPDSALGTSGRQVRCGKCQHLWHAMPEHPPLVEEPKIDAAVEPPKAAPDFDALMANISEKPKIERFEQELKPEAPLGGFSAPAFMRKRGFCIGFYIAAYVILITLLIYLLGLKFMPEKFGHASSQGFSFEAIKLERMVQLGGERFATTPLYSIEGIIRNTSEQPKVRPIIRVVLKKNTGGDVYIKTYPSPDSVISAGGAVSFKIERLERPVPSDTYFTIEMGNGLELTLRNMSDVRH